MLEMNRSQHFPTYLSSPVVESSLSSPFGSGAGAPGAAGTAVAAAFGAKGALGTGDDLGAEAFTGAGAGSLGSVGIAAGVAVGVAVGVGVGVLSFSDLGVPGAEAAILSQRQFEGIK